MAKRPPTKQERDDNLTALKDAVETWGKKEQDRLENEVKFMRAVLTGRTGPNAAGTSSLDSASTLLQAEINDFLTFGADEERE